MVCGESGAKGAGGVEGAAGEGTGDEDSERDDEADAEAGVGSGGVAVVDGGGENGEDEEECGDGFEDKAGENREVAGESGRAEGRSPPDFLRDDGAKKKCS